MRILFVSNFYPPLSWGGVEFYTHGIARELQQRGHPVQVICAGDWDKGPRHLNAVMDEIYEGIPVRRLNMNWAKAPNPFSYLYDNPIAANELRRLIADFRPDMLHVTSCSNLSTSVIFAAKQRGIPVVLTLADFWFICPRSTLLHADGHICNAQVSAWECTRCLAWRSRIYRWSRALLPDVQKPLLTKIGQQLWISRKRGFIGMIGDMEERRRTLSRAFAQVDVILSISHYVKEMFTHSGQLPGDNIRVHEWGLPAAQVTRTDQQAITARTPPMRIAYFGRIVPSKGVHILIQAFNQLHGDVTLDLHGSSDGNSSAYDVQLRTLTDGDSSIHFSGIYEPADAVRFMASYDVIVVPSVVPETYNLVAREALLAHTPIVASNVGAIPDAVWHDRNGLLVEPNDISALAAALQRLVNDPSLRVRLANGPRAIKTLGQEMVELIEIYREVTA